MFNEKICPGLFIQKRLVYENRHEPYHMRTTLPISLLKDFLPCCYHEVLRNRGAWFRKTSYHYFSVLQSSIHFTFQSSSLTVEHCILLLLCPRSPSSELLPPMPLPLPHFIKCFLSLRSLVFSIQILLLKVFPQIKSLALLKACLYWIFLRFSRI